MNVSSQRIIGSRDRSRSPPNLARCSRSGIFHLLEHMEDDGHGGYQCTRTYKCNTSRIIVERFARFDDSNASAFCSVSGFERPMRHMIEDGCGGYKCVPEFACTGSHACTLKYTLAVSARPDATTDIDRNHLVENDSQDLDARSSSHNIGSSRSSSNQTGRGPVFEFLRSLNARQWETPDSDRILDI